MTRWLALAFGLAIAVTALYLLAVGSSEPPAANAPGPGEIDDASRARLERVLKEADHREGRTR